ncbi:MAG: hypothetical protein ACPLKP_02860 [Microgenomates group bacterium]
MPIKNKFIIFLFSFLFFSFLFIILFQKKNSSSKIPQNIPPLSSQKCGIENCHGLEIKCGPNIPEVCSLEYQIGDGCRQFASCEIKEGKCQLVESDEFIYCKNCVEACIEKYSEEPEKLFNCEQKCLPS